MSKGRAFVEAIDAAAPRLGFQQRDGFLATTALLCHLNLRQAFLLTQSFLSGAELLLVGNDEGHCILQESVA